MLLPLNNRCFAALPAPVREALEPHLALVALQRGIALEAVATESSLYFPISCILAMTATATEGRGSFLRFGGRGVVVGIRTREDSESVRSEARVCVEGYAFVLPARRLAPYLDASVELEVAHVRLLRAVMKRALMGAHCASSHTAPQRIARLLLSCEGEFEAEGPIPFEQAQLSQWLVLRRETVTHVLRDWASEGLVETARAKIWVRDRVGLIAKACACLEGGRELDRQEFSAWADIKWRVPGTAASSINDEGVPESLRDTLKGVYSELD